MRNLVLWRHAEAEDLEEGGDDLLRRLTSKGRRQAARMAPWLNHFLPPDTRVFASPAARTRQTVQALGRPFAPTEALLPLANVEDVLAWLQSIDAEADNKEGTILLVGHQPWTGEVIAHFLGMQEQQCSVRKGAVWWLVTRMRDGKPQTVLRTVTDPDFILSSLGDRS